MTYDINLRYNMYKGLQIDTDGFLSSTFVVGIDVSIYFGVTVAPKGSM